MAREKGKKNITGKKAPARSLKEKRADKAAKKREKNGSNTLEIKAPLKVAKGTKAKK